jgi:choline dehydrogenase-like flavoprotein
VLTARYCGGVAVDNIPRHADTVVIGAGTAGAAVAAIVSEHSDQSILLLEAGPDYGALASGRWPADLLDARAIPDSHDWGYDSGQLYAPRVIKFERARVVGGCSSHNGCAAIWGCRLDYDQWAALGNPGWSTDELRPLFFAASDRLRVRIPSSSEITPYQQAYLDSAAQAGIPRVADLNNFDESLGVAPSPVNIDGGIRWNSSFGYLDPIRGRPDLTIAGNAIVDKLTIERNRAVRIDAVVNGNPCAIEVGRVVLAAGAYGSPVLLMRSGIGEPNWLRAAGVKPVLELAAVGCNLHDHPMVSMIFSGTPELVESTRRFGKEHWMPEEQTIAKVRSSRCGPGFDLHVYPVGGSGARQPRNWYWAMAVACLTPRSRGTIRLRSADPLAAPIIDHRYISDASGEDLQVLADGLEIARGIAARHPMAKLVGEERLPGGAVRSRSEIENFVRANVAHYYHPVGTCRMGHAQEPESVVDARGRVHGLDNVYVADASIMPTIPRANTNLPALVVGERIARWLVER